MRMPADRAEVLDLRAPQRVHIVGIGGAGMSAIALVLRSMGHTVSGSDLKESPVAARLRSQGIEVAIGHRVENVGDVDAVTFSPAVASTNPEILAAANRGARVVARSGMLAAICATRRSLAVAGTKGKTTTASMLSLILIEAGLRPSFLIGADVNEVGTNAVWDTGEWLVVEADESFGTFQELRPDWAIVTNVASDHLDHYGTFPRLRAAFDTFVGQATEGSVVSADDDEAAGIGRAHGSLRVGTAVGATFAMTDLVLHRSSASFTLTGPEGVLGKLTLGVPGLHNARNAALAVVTALQVGVSFEAAAAALARFAGVTRRFEFRGERNGVTFVDDYAHLPSEVRAGLGAARSGGYERVVCVFQPHRYSRIAALAADFASAFVDCDVLFVTDIYSAGEPVRPGVTGRLVSDAVLAAHPDADVTYTATHEELLANLRRRLRTGDCCITLEAGDLTGLPDELLSDETW
jgi:UDP-N-acetylmuramate--alanine ligase